MQHEKLERAAAPRRGGRLAVRAHHPAQDQTQVVRGIDRDEDVDRLVRRGGADLQATRRERHGESSYAHVLLKFLFLTDTMRPDKTSERTQECIFFLAWSKEQKRVFHQRTLALAQTAL